MPYNKQEEEQIAYIHDQYDQCGLGKIPPLLEVEEVTLSELLPVIGINKKIQGKYPAKKEHFEATEMKKRLHQGPLRSHAENILIKICAYQKERSSRPGGIGAGTLDDPIHLLLEEVKHWTIHTLSAFGCHVDLQQQVNARMNYLKMLEKSDLFPAGKLGDLHLGSTLLEVIDELQEAKITIKATLESASAEMELKQLVFGAKNLLQHTTQYLYFIFRSETSDDFTFDNMRHPHQNDKPMRGILHTKTGEFLRALIHSTPFLKLFPDEKTPALNAPAPVRDGIALTLSPTIEENPFLSQDLLPTQENQTSYGVYALFLAQPTIMAAFIALHALLLELGHFTLVCEDLVGLARWGGDILIYGLAHQKVALFLQQYFSLMDALFTRLSAIQQFARMTYKTQKQAESRDGWLNNYNKAESIYTEIEKDKLACDGWANNILTKSRHGISEYQRKKILEQITQVLGEVDGFSQRMDYLMSHTPLPNTHPPLLSQEKTLSGGKARYTPVVHTRKNQKTIQNHTLSIQHQPLLKEPIMEQHTEEKDKRLYEAADTSHQGAYQRVFYQKKDKLSQTDKNSYQPVDLRRNTAERINDSKKKVPLDIFDDSSSLEDDSYDEQIEMSNIHRELMFKKGETPLYLQKVIASFNDPHYESEIALLWQNHFEKQKGMGGKGKVKSSQKTHKKDDEQVLDFLDEFENDLHLPTAGALSITVTKLVKAFEQNDLDHTKPTSLGAKLFNENELWESCHHELFYLKYLCVKAAKSDDNQWSNKTDERDLKEFIERLKDESPMGKGWNYFSDYKNLKNQLIEVYEQIKNYRLKPRKVPHHQVHQNKRLEGELKKYEAEMQKQNDKHHQEIQKFKSIIGRKNALIQDQTDEIEKRNKQIIEQAHTIETQQSKITAQDKKNDEFDTQFKNQRSINRALAAMLLSKGNLSEEDQETIKSLVGEESHRESYQRDCKK